MIKDVDRSIYLDTKRMAICFIDDRVIESIAKKTAVGVWRENKRFCYSVLVADFDLLMNLFKESYPPGSLSFEESDFRGMIDACVDNSIIDNEKAKRVVEMFFQKPSNA